MSKAQTESDMPTYVYTAASNEWHMCIWLSFNRWLNAHSNAITTGICHHIHIANTPRSAAVFYPHIAPSVETGWQCQQTATEKRIALSHQPYVIGFVRYLLFRNDHIFYERIQCSSIERRVRWGAWKRKHNYKAKTQQECGLSVWLLYSHAHIHTCVCVLERQFCAGTSIRCFSHLFPLQCIRPKAKFLDQLQQDLSPDIGIIAKWLTNNHLEANVCKTKYVYAIR